MSSVHRTKISQSFKDPNNKSCKCLKWGSAENKQKRRWLFMIWLYCINFNNNDLNRKWTQEPPIHRLLNNKLNMQRLNYKEQCATYRARAPPCGWAWLLLGKRSPTWRCPRCSVRADSDIQGRTASVESLPCTKVWAVCHCILSLINAPIWCLSLDLFYRQWKRNSKSLNHLPRVTKLERISN